MRIAELNSILQHAQTLPSACQGEQRKGLTPFLDREISGFSIDSRTLKSNDLFIAIRGENFDGHDFAAKAVEKGAIGVVCERISTDTKDVPQWVVPNTIEALALMATYQRQQITCPIIALTGSNGKTTVKDMLSSILPSPSLATKGNFNNHIGAPLSVLALSSAHQAAVFELGANHIGEILHTVKIVQPTVTLINNIGPAHLEGFGSIEGVAIAKGEIHQGLMPGGTAVVNEDDAYAHFWDEYFCAKKVIRFSQKTPQDVFATDIILDEKGCAGFRLVMPTGEAKVQLRVPGLHNVSNALAAAACAAAIDLSSANVADSLSHFAGVAGRMTYQLGRKNALIIDDTYNANLRSTLAAIDVLKKCVGTRIVVFGDMGELGSVSHAHHAEVGLAAKANGIDVLLTVGTQSEHATIAFGDGARHFATKAALLEFLQPKLDKNTTVLVKGSRSSAMEEVVSALTADSVGE